MKHYFLIKQWFPDKGQTSDAPNGYFCGGWACEYPLTSVKEICTYSSKARAEKVAAKWRTLRSHTEVVEISPDIVLKWDGKEWT